MASVLFLNFVCNSSATPLYEAINITALVTWALFRHGTVARRGTMARGGTMACRGYPSAQARRALICNAVALALGILVASD